MKTKKLNNGLSIPLMGLGTSRIGPRENIKDIIFIEFDFKLNF